MKVALIRERQPQWRPPGSILIPMTASKPFYYSPSAGRVHRVRSGSYHGHNGQITHASFRLWCGQGGHISPKHKGNKLMAEPPRTMPVCATCEGRARGAGQLESHMIAGRFVLFTPQR